MRISDEDRVLAKELRDLFDLNDQDEGALRVILSSHRQLPANEVRGPYGTCDEPYPDWPAASCKRARGHDGFHEAVPGPHATSVRWETKPACREFYDNTNPNQVARCGLLQGHVAKHVVASGPYAGTSWSDNDPE